MTFFINAAIAGAVVGTLLLGPFCGILCGGGAAYAASKGSGELGKTAKKVGNVTIDGAKRATSWVKKHLDKM